MRDQAESSACETRSREDYVYFIQGESGGPVKIGRSANPAKRLVELQTGYFETLVLRAVIPNTMGDLEAKLHRAFAPWHLRGEWFRPTPLMVKCGRVRLDGYELEPSRGTVDLPPI